MGRLVLLFVAAWALSHCDGATDCELACEDWDAACDLEPPENALGCASSNFRTCEDRCAGHLDDCADCFDCYADNALCDGVPAPPCEPCEKCH